MKRNGSLVLFFCILTVMIGVFPAAAQTRQAAETLKWGIELYGDGWYWDAIEELRHVQEESPDPGQRAEALYWISMAEMATGDYGAALWDMYEYERILPTRSRRPDISYNRGRAFYYLGRYDEALVELRYYADQLGDVSDDDLARKSSTLYWMGECLYALGQLSQANEIFTIIVDQYPQSVKFEAANYRVALINQKKIETELLEILKWSHEESLRTVEDFQRREHTYDQAIIAYQQRIADMLKEGRMAELEEANAEYQRRLLDAEARINQLESSLRAAGASVPTMGPPPSSGQTTPSPSADAVERQIRLLSLKSDALDLRSAIMSEEALKPASSLEDRR